jgi:hypothetical protein
MLEVLTHVHLNRLSYHIMHDKLAVSHLKDGSSETQSVDAGCYAQLVAMLLHISSWLPY